jgi:hypothetical protein
MKTKTILIAAVMFLALSAAAFAQATFTVGSTPVTTVTRSGLSEKTGDISFTTVVDSPDLVTGTISINYGANITYHPGGVFSGSLLVPTSDVSVLSAVGNTLVLGIMHAIPAPYTFRVTGIRVSVYGTGLQTLDATISSTNNLITAGETVARVVNSIAPGLASFEVTDPVSFNAIFGGGCGTAYLNAEEGYLNAFGVTAASEASQNSATMVRFEFTLPPSGITLSFPAASGNFTQVDALGAATGATSLSHSSTNLYIYYMVTTDTNPLAIETLVVPVEICATTPVELGTITVKATLAKVEPTGIYNGTRPSYAADVLTAANSLVQISSGSSMLLLPYAVNWEGYNTGIAIANTTTDPGLEEMGFTDGMETFPQDGAITFYFYSREGDQFNYTTTAGSPGQGLNAQGKVPSGGMYTVLLSELLNETGWADFTGYIFVKTNFTNAHGEYFVSNFIDFTHGALMLVIDTENEMGRPVVEKLDN